ncbi:transglycosylase domain-containing protein [Lutibacter sp.]|uniref:transglycosylase domain-containing protein n=1 Tax=Lutibacter sp. TaxID=1925666 RepID=UPI00273322A2|nr:transglycosylase domain-containing protein [Lutibacter sp.]MDP3312384.1 transglycosylase domain-containing protein [Lutibacter sp.]
MNLLTRLKQYLILNFNFKNYTKKNWFNFIKKGSLVFIGLFIFFIITLYFGIFGRVPTNKEVKLFRNMEASEVYSADNVLLYRFDKENRVNIPFDSIPKHLVEALVATEDSRFYEHSGVDLKSLFRVAIKTIILQDKSSGGGSTITQQLVKNYFPRNSYWFFSTPINKFEEMIAAYKLESHFTKDQIIEFYFNTVPFGDTAFGIESASQRFFSTSTSKLSIEQSAILVGMLKATYTYNPLKFPEEAENRRNLVLNLMSENKFISTKFKDSIIAIPLLTKEKRLSRHQGKAKYFTEYVRQVMKDWLEINRKPSGKKYDLYKDGLKIYTSLNFEMQKYAEKAVAKRLKILQYEFENQWRGEDPWQDVPIVLTNAIKNSKRYKSLKNAGFSESRIQDSLNKPVKMKLFSHDGDVRVTMSPLDSIKNSLRLLHASFIAMEPQTGQIKAYVGGIDENYFQYDHVTTKRQVGSSFKPFVFATAIENGISPCDMYPNILIKYPQYEDWEPKNSDYIYGGEFSVWGALAASINTVTVQLMDKVGLPKIINLSKSMGIETELPAVASLALGTAELSLLEMVRAYTTFPNYGKPSYEVAITKIIDREGNSLNVLPVKETKKVYSEKTAQVMVEMLKRVVVNGISAGLRYDFQLFNDIGGKTGTSQSQADGWFIGFTSNLVTGAWVGAENPAIHFKTMASGQASHTALPINGEFLRMLNKDPSFQYYLKEDFRKLPKDISALFNCNSRKNVPSPPKDTIADIVIDTIAIENIVIDSLQVNQ